MQSQLVANSTWNLATSGKTARGQSAAAYQSVVERHVRGCDVRRGMMSGVNRDSPMGRKWVS